MDNLKFDFTKKDTSTSPDNITSRFKTVADMLDKANISFEEIEFSKNTAYTRAFILKHKSTPGANTVRIYRGINDMQTILDQEPYINRFKKYATLPAAEKDTINASLLALVQSPSKQNLDNHINLITPYLDNTEKKELSDDMKIILEGEAAGYSIRKMIHQQQIAHPMGSSTFGISPYLSTTYEKSQVYAGDVILVIDVPVSHIEDWGPENNAETNYVGKLSVEHIAAIVIKKEYDPFVYQRNSKEESESTLISLENSLPKISKESMHAARVLRHAELLQKDAEIK